MIASGSENFITTDKYNTLKIWNMKGKLLKTFKEFYQPVKTIKFSPDGSLIATGTGSFEGEAGAMRVGGVIDIWDIKGNKQYSFPNHTAKIYSIDYSRDGKFIASCSKDATLKLWNFKNNNFISVVADNTDWIIYTPDGYFDASYNGGKLINIRSGNEIFGIDQFAIKYNRPDIILKRLGLGSDDQIKYFYHQYTKRLRRMGFLENQLSSDIHVPKTEILNIDKEDKFFKLEILLSDSKVKILSYNIYINDVPMYGAFGKSISQLNNLNQSVGISKISINDTKELCYGKNKIEVSCINENGAESHRAIKYISYDNIIDSDLYFLAFGVSDYKNDRIKDLEYAHQDAKDLEQMFLKMKRKPYKNIFTKIFLNREVTLKAITDGKAFLKDSKVDDIFIFFISGHGIHDIDSEKTYYYITYDTDPQNLSGTAANFNLIENLLYDIPPRKKLFLMDTCESGEIDNDIADKYTMAANRGMLPRTMKGLKVDAENNNKNILSEYIYKTDRYIYNDLMRRSGAIVFSSSQGGEASWEDAKFQNGLFTEGIINGIENGLADINKDGLVSTDELRDYVRQSVSQMSKGIQHPTVDRDNIYIKFNIPVISN